eukprot:1434869-Alexandrium_andersonii.AAC.1
MFFGERAFFDWGRCSIVPVAPELQRVVSPRAAPGMGVGPSRWVAAKGLEGSGCLRCWRWESVGSA